MDCSPTRRAPFAATAQLAKRILYSELPPVPEPLYTSRAIYDASMDIKMPLTAIALYLSCVLAINGRSKRDYTKGPVARTLVITHNVALCLYSGALRSLRALTPHSLDVLAHLADSLPIVRHAASRRWQQLSSSLLRHRGL